MPGRRGCATAECGAPRAQSARLLVAAKEDLAKERRKLLTAKIAGPAGTDCHHRWRIRATRCWQDCGPVRPYFAPPASSHLW